MRQRIPRRTPSRFHSWLPSVATAMRGSGSVGQDAKLNFESELSALPGPDGPFLPFHGVSPLDPSGESLLQDAEVALALILEEPVGCLDLLGRTGALEDHPASPRNFGMPTTELRNREGASPGQPPCATRAAWAICTLEGSWSPSPDRRDRQKGGGTTLGSIRNLPRPGIGLLLSRDSRSSRLDRGQPEWCRAPARVPPSTPR